MPEPNTRPSGSPAASIATDVTTSTGLVTIRITASGATSSNCGTIVRQILALTAASSSRL